MKRERAAWIVITLIVLGLYPTSYAALRLTHVLVHTSGWTSEEGVDFHHIHAIEASGPTAHAWLPLFRPLTWAETALQRRHQP